MYKTLIVAALAAGVLLTGCSGANTQAATSQTDAVPQQATQTSADANPADGEAPPEIKMDYGEISELMGNAITVKEIETPKFGAGGGQRFEVPLDAEGNPDFSQMELPEGVTIGEDGQVDFSRMERSEGASSGGQIPEGFTPGEGMPEGFTPGEGGARSSRQGGTGGAASGEEREPNYTGEEIEIFIPVGLPITTVQTNEEGVAEEKELKLEDIKIGNMITVMYKEDGTTIDSVSISDEVSGGMPMGGRQDGFFFAAEADAGARDGDVVYFTTTVEE